MARSRRSWPGTEPGYKLSEDLTGLPSLAYCRVSSNPDQEDEKSVDDQETAYLAWVEKSGVTSKGVVKDDNRSASKFASKQRENFEQVQNRISAEHVKVVWFWSTSRQTRGDIPLDVLARNSEKHGVLWCVNGQLYNPANDDDMLMLDFHHIMDKRYSTQISKDVTRGKNGSALDGKPAAAAPYGYRRVYDHDVMVKGKPKFVRDEPNVFDGNGRAIQDSPAYVVREIFDRLARGDYLAAIRRDLEARRIPTPRKPRKHPDYPCRWSLGAIRFIATNPAYIGKRVHQAEGTRAKDRFAAILPGVQCKWEPLVTEEQFWAVQRIFDSPTVALPDGRVVPRLFWRPATRNHLLTSLARCGECGDAVIARSAQRNKGSVSHYYKCMRRACVAVREDWLDQYVEDRVVSWLASPEVYAHLWASRQDDSATAAAARGEVERIQHKIAEWRSIAGDPDSDPATVDQAVRGLVRKLREAEQLARPASLSPVLAEAIGPDAADKWVALDMSIKRQIIQMVADVKVLRSVSKGGHWKSREFDEDRVEWRWLLGPDAGREG